MTGRRNGFTLVEVIVVLVILAILAAIMIPAMTGWIDKAKEKRLIVGCRTCVTAAQTLVAEAYGVSGTSTPPDGSAVVALAGVKGTASNISLDAASAAVDTLTYSDGKEAMTYTRLPTPKYEIGAGLAGPMSAASNWAQNYQYGTGDLATKQYLTMDYSYENPSALSQAQVNEIFGDLVPAGDAQYIYPMAIFDKNGKLLNIQYVTPRSPTTKDIGGLERFLATALIIDGKTYISTAKDGDKVKGRTNARGANDAGVNAYTFQRLMNNQLIDSTQGLVDMITKSGYFTETK